RRHRGRRRLPGQPGRERVRRAGPAASRRRHQNESLTSTASDPLSRTTQRGGTLPEPTPGPVGPVDGRLVPRYAGASTFARLPEVDRVTDYDVAVLGVPFDNGTSYRPGARFGPMAVRQASRHLRPGYHVELGLSPFQTVQVTDAGDVPVTPFDI